MKRKSRRGRDVVQVDDVLAAMADSLMEKQPKAFKPTLTFHDKPRPHKLGGRPPREIFYRQTSTFLTKLPPPIQQEVCGCQYLCNGLPATVKCHSCALYHPAGQAYYCTLCFSARHPWHRIPHVYTAIEQDESIEKILRMAHRLAEAQRYGQEGTDLLARLTQEKKKLTHVGDDEALDDKIWDYGRRMVALEEQVATLRQRLRQDSVKHSQQKTLMMESTEANLLKQKQISQEIEEMMKDDVEEDGKRHVDTTQEDSEREVDHPPSPLLSWQETANGNAKGSDFNRIEQTTSAEEEDMTRALPLQRKLWDEEGEEGQEEEKIVPPLIPAHSTHAVVTIQKVVKGHLARKIVSLMLASRVVRVWSPQFARDYYYDRVSGESSWIPSKLMRTEHLDSLLYVTEASPNRKWHCKDIVTTVERRQPRRLLATTQQAVLILQNFTRCVLARKRLIARADLAYRRIFDEESGSWYYANVITGTTSWNKPAFYLLREPPFLSSTGSDRRSPRLQRVLTSP
eukprot:gene2794-3048_t